MAKRDDDGEGTERDRIVEVQALLRSFDTAMLTTLTPENLVRARPMEIEDPSELDDCDLWFVTSADSPKANEITYEQSVGVSCHRSLDGAFLSISALASVDHDPETIRRLWKPSWCAWFPDGMDDPALALLKLTIKRAEYWDEMGDSHVLYDGTKSALAGAPRPERRAG